MPGRGGNHGPYGRYSYVLYGVATLAVFSAAPAVARYEPPWSTVEGAYVAGYIMEEVCRFRYYCQVES